jgi:SAM-dependent methyltransferase
MARERRLVFGEVAEQYDRSRPSYPDALVDELVALAGLGPGRRVLEVGAGTGKATAMFALRGVPLLALEPSAAMAAVARRKLESYPEVELVESDFERWDPRGAEFSLIYAAQSWHWVTPELGYLRARAALTPGGLLAVFWNRPRWGRVALRDELAAVYAIQAPDLDTDSPMHPAGALAPERQDSWEREIAQSPSFVDAQIRNYDWTCEYSAGEYARLLETHSDTRMLSQERRARLLAAVAGEIERRGGSLQMSYVTRLCLARAV